MRVALLVLLTASVASAEGLRGSVTGGFGMGRDLLGVQLEAGAGHWTGFFAFSPSGLFSESFAAGGRWSMRPDGSGFGLALQAQVWSSSGVGDHWTNTVVAATAHWRWRWSYFIADVGAGPAFSWNRYRYATGDSDIAPADWGKLTGSSCFGIVMDGTGCGAGTLPLDLEVGLGFAF